MTIRKRAAIRALAFFCAALAVLGILLLRLNGEKQALNRRIRAGYARSFTDLVTCMDGIDSSLQKSLCATSPAVASGVCAEVFGKAMAAKAALSCMPFSSYELEHTSSFLTKTGDYAYSLSRAAASGGGFSEEELANLSALSQNAAGLSRELRGLYEKVDSGEIMIGDLRPDGSGQADGTETSEEEPTDLAGSFRRIEENFGEVPALVYDGLYSDDLTGRKPAALEGLAETEEADALRAAADAMGADAADLEITGRRDGRLSVYVLRSRTDDGVSAEVTCAGGLIAYFEKRADTEGEPLSDEDAARAALDYLGGLGMDGMAAAWLNYSGSSVTVNCVYSQDGVYCYPDLVKVTLAPDSSVTGLDVSGYLMNHARRELPQAAAEEEQARSDVPAALSVLEQRMAVIPTAGQREVYCYEFLCENGDGGHYLVYVNAETGEEESVLVLTEDENGTMAG